MFDHEAFKTALEEAKDNPGELGTLFAEVIATFSAWIQEMRPFVGSADLVDWKFEAEKVANQVRTDFQNASKMESCKREKVSAPLNPHVMADGFAAVESRSVRIRSIAMHPEDFADIRKFGRDLWDIETRKPFLIHGILGYIWSAVLYVSTDVTPGNVYIMGGIEGQPITYCTIQQIDR